MRKIYLLLSMLAMFALLSAMTSVKAQYSTSFSVNVDPFMLGWTELPGVDPVYGENLYKDIGVGNTGRTAAGDVRLTPVFDGAGGWYPVGSIVAASDIDVSAVANLKITYGTGVNTVKHTDPDADTYYDYGEFIYKDADSNTFVSAGDVRYSNPGGYKVGSTVVAGDTDTGPALTTFKPALAGQLEKYTDNFEKNSLYDFARLYVDIMISTDIPDNTADGVVGYGFKCFVNPDVLTPFGWKGAAAGTFLSDYLVRWSIPLTSAIVGQVNPDYLDVSEQILGTMTEGAGLADGVTPEKLLTLVFIPQSKTGHSMIDLLENPGGDYMTPDGLWHSVTMTDGSYNVPLGPEFPLGLTPVVMLAPMIPILYVWRMRKRRVR